MRNSWKSLKQNVGRIWKSNKQKSRNAAICVFWTQTNLKYMKKFHFSPFFIEKSNLGCNVVLKVMRLINNVWNSRNGSSRDSQRVGKKIKNDCFFAPPIVRGLISSKTRWDPLRCDTVNSVAPSWHIPDTHTRDTMQRYKRSPTAWPRAKTTLKIISLDHTNAKINRNAHTVENQGIYFSSS